MQKTVLVLFIVKKQQELLIIEDLEAKVRNIGPWLHQLSKQDNVVFLIIREKGGLGNFFICLFPHPPHPVYKNFYLVGMPKNGMLW